MTELSLVSRESKEAKLSRIYYDKKVYAELVQIHKNRNEEVMSECLKRLSLKQRYMPPIYGWKDALIKWFQTHD